MSTSSNDEIQPERVTDATTPDGVDGTTEGNPVAGVEISEEERQRAVTPSDDVQEVDGPPQSHP